MRIAISTLHMMSMYLLTLLSHALQIFDMSSEGGRKGWQIVVTHAMLLTYLLDQWRNSWVMVLADRWEEVVDRLVVQSTGQHGDQPIAMSIIDTGVHLVDRPFIGQWQVNIWPYRSWRYVTHLKVECQKVSRHKLGNEEGDPKSGRCDPKEVQWYNNAPEGPK